MVVDDLDVVGVAVVPTKADTPLVVHADAVLSRAISGELLRAHLNIYFLNATDVQGPSTREEWLGALQLVESFLGVRRHSLSPYVHTVIIDTKDVPTILMKQ